MDHGSSTNNEDEGWDYFSINRWSDKDDSDDDSWTIMTLHKPYDQFLLFGDSITEQSGCQDRGFAFAPALQDGM